jgi:hypothetical protein
MKEFRQAAAFKLRKGCDLAGARKWRFLIGNWSRYQKVRELSLSM